MVRRSFRSIFCIALLAGTLVAVPVMARPTRGPSGVQPTHRVRASDTKHARGHHKRHRSPVTHSRHWARPKSDPRATETTETGVAANTTDPVSLTPSHLIWSEEFSGPAGSSPSPDSWNFDTGGKGWGNEELESYTSRPQNSNLDGKGDLDITARAESYTGADGILRRYTSARLQTLHKFQFQYGLIEARIQVPAGKGLWPAFWLLGNEGYASEHAWPDCGEIDAMEVLGSEPNVVHGTLHAPWPWASKDGLGGRAESPKPLSAGFHVYGVEWSPRQISFLLDGAIYQTITPADLPPGAPWPFDHQFFLLLNLAVGGDWPGAPNTSTHLPAHMLVDWVRVWQ